MAVHPQWHWVTVDMKSRRNTGNTHIAKSVRVEGSIPAARLDHILARTPQVAMIKVDAQGTDADVLRSGLNIIDRDGPLIATEAATPEELEEIRNILKPMGYETIGRYCSTPTYLWKRA
jgi:hypothetical protein